MTSGLTTILVLLDGTVTAANMLIHATETVGMAAGTERRVLRKWIRHHIAIRGMATNTTDA